jgi:hypothetical protein
VGVSTSAVPMVSPDPRRSRFRHQYTGRFSTGDPSAADISRGIVDDILPDVIERAMRSRSLHATAS